MRPRPQPGSTWLLSLAFCALGSQAFAQPAPIKFRRSAGDFPANATGSRVAFGDFDLDGDPDLLLNGRLLLNDGSGKFTFAPRRAGLHRRVRAAVCADYDRDGDLDVYLSGGGASPDRLMRNDTTTSGGTTRVLFTDVSATVGQDLNDTDPGEGVAWGDVNGDGYPDLYVANYETSSGSAQGTMDRLYINRRGRRLVDRSYEAQSWRVGRGVCLVDFDQDGDVDVHVSNYRLQPNRLWVNGLKDTGAFSLTDEAQARAVARAHPLKNGHTIGSTWGDLDGDGDLDLVSANLAHPDWRLWISDKSTVHLQGSGLRFRATMAGIKYQEAHSHPTLFDADNDGDLDLYITSTYGQPGFLYRNMSVETGTFSFRDVTQVAKARTRGGWGSAAADVDGDGDQDLVVVGAQGRPILLRNRNPRRSGSVRIRLVGTRSETWGAGATVKLRKQGAPTLVRQITLGHGTSCQSEPILHFGTGSATGPWRAVVKWPSGSVTRLRVQLGLNTISEPTP